MNRYILHIALGLGLVGQVVLLYRITRRSNRKPKIKQPSSINEVLFFPDAEFPCRQVTNRMASCPAEQRICHSPSCRKLHGRIGESHSSMIKFLNYLASATKSVDLCIYVFTQVTMAEILLDLHERNVRVRIITDGSEDEADGSQTEKLRKAGIEIKSNKRGTGALMHHKFVVIDELVLLSGSFNWTSKAVVSNYEAVLVTSNPNIVVPFNHKFNEMWSAFGSHTKSRISFRN